MALSVAVGTMVLGSTQPGLSSSPKSQDTKRHLAAVKTTDTVTVDGDLTKPFWKDAAVAQDFVDYVNGSKPADQTRVLVKYSEKFLYFGFICLDSSPQSVTARETVRDAKYSGGPNGVRDTEDNIEIQLEPFFTHNWNDLSLFSVNAIGTKSAQIAGGRGSKAEWKGDWEAAVRRTSEGWTCEIRIPWETVQHPSNGGPRSMGINFSRYINRTKSSQEWSHTGPNGFLENEGSLDGVEMPAMSFKPKLSLLPFALGGDIGGGKFAFKQGIDARYTLTPKLTAVGTLYPDYSNIENSIQSIAFSHVTRFVPDQRPFFTEGGNNFGMETNINDIGSFFYSTAIGQFDTGTKLYGKLTPNDSIGFLDALSFGKQNDFAARYLHNFSDTSSGGAMIVGSSNPASPSIVTAADGHIRTGKLQLESIIANSEGPAAGGGAQIVSSNYQDRNWTHVLQYSEISNNFVAPDGYFPYTGYKGPVAIEAYSATWRHGFWRQLSATGIYADLQQFANQGGLLRGEQFELNMYAASDTSFDLNHNDTKYIDSPDNFWNFTVTQGVTNRFLQYGLQVGTGILGGEKTTSFGPQASFRVLKKLDLNYTGLYQNRVGITQQHILTANYELSPTRSFGGRLVTQNADTNLFLFYHNSGGKGTDYFIIFGKPDALRTQLALQLKLVFSI